MRDHALCCLLLPLCCAFLPLLPLGGIFRAGFFLLSLLARAATEQHSKTTRDALTGKGIDRHLSALEEMGRKAGVPNPAIFTDKGMQVAPA
jgi:hypothetical protein